MPKHRLGSLDHNAACSNMMPGPMSVEELFNWPLDILSRFRAAVAPATWGRLLSNLDRGILSTSDFSGWDSQCEVTRLLRIGLMQLTGEELNGIIWLRSSDCGLPQRHVLREMSCHQGGHQCVLGDINKHVDRDVEKLLDELEPEEGMSSQLKSKLYAQQMDILMQSSIAFPRSQVAWCFQHRRGCPVNILGIAGMILKDMDANAFNCNIEDEAGPAGCMKKKRKVVDRFDTTVAGASPWWRLVMEDLAQQQSQGIGTSPT